MQKLKPKPKLNKLPSFRALELSSYFKSFRAKREDGLTLIELLMAMSLFALTSTVIVAVFLSMVSGHRRSLNAITLDNAAYIAIETIAKEIRTGGYFSCTSNCEVLSFTNYRGQDVSYKRTINVNGNYQVEKTCSGAGCASGMVTPSNINISYLKFDLEGIGRPDNMQSKITIVLTAQTPAGIPAKYQRTLNLQTTISSRNLDS